MGCPGRGHPCHIASKMADLSSFHRLFGGRSPAIPTDRNSDRLPYGRWATAGFRFIGRTLSLGTMIAQVAGSPVGPTIGGWSVYVAPTR